MANVVLEERLWLGADKLRDTLLPKLLFGEFSLPDAPHLAQAEIPEAEKMVETVA